MKKETKRFKALKRAKKLKKIKKCQRCGASANKIKLYIHHILPKSMGGSDKKCNLMKVCRECHRELDELALNPWKKYIDKKECCVCGEEGLTLGEVEKLDIKAFNKIPMKDVVKLLYAKGYTKKDVFCEECILK